MTARLALSLLTLALAAVIGCSSTPVTDGRGPLDEAETTDKADPADPADPTHPRGQQPAATAEPVPVRVVDKAEYDALIAEHVGKVIVVDFWATWCEPCKERFPHMVELAAQFPAEDVVFLSVSLDETSDQQQVERQLGQFGAGEMINLLSELDPTSAFEAYDIRAGIPNYKLYDRSGDVRYEFALQQDDKLNLLSADELDAKLRELLVAE